MIIHSGEGGCGACTVMVTRKSASSGGLYKLTVNACITPVMSLHLCHVTTIEGLGDSKNPHFIQKQLAAFHATQCGFCTPVSTFLFLHYFSIQMMQCFINSSYIFFNV